MSVAVVLILGALLGQGDAMRHRNSSSGDRLAALKGWLGMDQKRALKGPADKPTGDGLAEKRTEKGESAPNEENIGAQGQPGEQQSHSSWNWATIRAASPLGTAGGMMILAGVLLTNLGSLSAVTGKQLLRYSFLNDSRFAYGLGSVLAFILVPILDALAFAFAPQSILLPLAGMDVMLNVMLAPWTLGERLTRARLMGSVMVCAGTAIAVACGPHSDITYSAPALPSVLVQTSSLAYYFVFALWATCCYFVTLSPALPPFFKKLAMCALPGSIAGNQFFAKATVRLFSTQPIEVVLREPIFWFCLLCLALVSVTTAVIISRATKDCETLFMQPIYAGASIITGTVSAMLVMNEGGDHPQHLMISYIAGVSVILAGLQVICNEEFERPMLDALEKPDVVVKRSVQALVLTPVRFD